MLDGNDKETFHALRLLRDSVAQGTKPIIFWIGAGASAWCKYPLWGELSESVHSTFLKYEPNYESNLALKLMNAKRYPDFFTICRDTNRKRYFSILESTFAPKAVTPVYERFTKMLAGIHPCFVLTTNVDQCIEGHLTGSTTVQRTDLERCLDLLQQERSFVCKLHGSISSIESVIFTTDDYEGVLHDKDYLYFIGHIFTEAIVVFIGYSLGDQYVIDSLLASASHKRIFGDGPHFAVTSNREFAFPGSVRAIRYLPNQYGDHRSAILVADIVRSINAKPKIDVQGKSKSERDVPELISAYYISDLYPPGTWETSRNVEAQGQNGHGISFTVGQGFTSAEIGDKTFTAMHDLVVGLICFDTIYFPLSFLTKAHELLGARIFWHLVGEGVIRFVHLEGEPGIIYQSKESVVGGDMGIIIPRDWNGHRPCTINETIRRHLIPVPGKEAVAEAQFATLESMVVVFSEKDSHSTPDLVRGGLLHPAVRCLLGFSDAILPTSIPRWLMFPVLRLAHVINVAQVCDYFHIAATKIAFGGEKLAGAAFAVAAAQNWVDEIATYVLAGRFNADIGNFVRKDPAILRAIMKYRDTEEGTSLSLLRST